jgi:hypothetical protein
VVSAADPPRSLFSVFETGAATFLSSSSLFILTRAEWPPFQTHCYSENPVALGIEPGISVLATTNSDKTIIRIIYKNSMASSGIEPAACRLAA